MPEEYKGSQSLERDRLSVLLAMTLVSAALFRFVELPTFSWSVRRIFGSALGVTVTGDWILTLLVMGMAATGTLYLIQTHPQRESTERPLALSLVTPTLGSLLAALLLVRAQTWPLWLGALLLTGLLVGVLENLTYKVFSPDNPGYPSSRTLLNIIDYLLAFALFSLVLSGQGRALITGPAVLLISGLLSIDLLSASGAPLRAVLLFGSISGLLGGELAWLLGYWPVSFWMAATLLTLNLYMLVGLSYQYLLGRLTRRVFAEFAFVGLLVLIMLLWIRP